MVTPYQPAIDPAILQQLMQAMAMGGDLMLGPQDYNSLPYVGPVTGEDAGSLEAQNDRLTALGKGTDRFMDPGFALSLGNSIGAPGPEAYEPITAYQPLEGAAGQQLAYNWMNSNDPLKTMIATLASQGVGSGAIINQIQTILSDPNHEDYEAIRPFVPGTVVQADRFGGAPTVDPNVPDFNFITNTVNELTSALDSDTQQWDGETIDPETGLPAMATQQDSPMMEKLREAGFTNTPYETYDPNSFAPEGALEQEAQWAEAAPERKWMYDDANYQWQQLRKQYKDAQARANAGMDSVRDSPELRAQVAAMLDNIEGNKVTTMGPAGLPVRMGTPGVQEPSVPEAPIEAVGGAADLRNIFGINQPSTETPASGYGNLREKNPGLPDRAAPQSQNTPMARRTIQTLAETQNRDLLDRRNKAGTDMRRAYNQQRREFLEAGGAARGRVRRDYAAME